MDTTKQWTDLFNNTKTITKTPTSDLDTLKSIPYFREKISPSITKKSKKKAQKK